MGKRFNPQPHTYLGKILTEAGGREKGQAHEFTAREVSAIGHVGRKVDPVDRVVRPALVMRLRHLIYTHRRPLGRVFYQGGRYCWL
jgi:hypothetical protein